MSEYKSVAELLEAPERWTKGWSAKDVNGKWVMTNNQEAVCWCVGAAVERVYPDTWEGEFKKLEAVVGKEVIKWNDAPERTHAEVLQAVRAAGI